MSLRKLFFSALVFASLVTTFSQASAPAFVRGQVLIRPLNFAPEDSKIKGDSPTTDSP